MVIIDPFVSLKTSTVGVISHLLVLIVIKKEIKITENILFAQCYMQGCVVENNTAKVVFLYYHGTMHYFLLPWHYACVNS